MDAAARRQILADLGIVPWQLRAPAGDGVPAPARVAAGAGQEQASGSASGAAAGAAAGPVAGPGAVEPSAADASPGGARGTAESAAAGAAAESFSILSLASGDTLMLIDGATSRRDVRLAMDVLGAASGDTAKRPVRRRFDWPPADGGIGIHAGGQAARRALAAFVDKDVSDHAARRVLCTPEVVARWPADTTAVERIVVPSLASLGQDPAVKRALWQRLRAGA